MKALILAAAAGAIISLSNAAHAGEYFTDPLLMDFAKTGQIISPMGITATTPN